MGNCVFANGAFGWRVGESAKNASLGGLRMNNLAQEFRVAMEKAAKDLGTDDSEELSEHLHAAAKPWVKTFAETMKIVGVKVPVGSELIWTGTEDARIGEDATEADEWILGRGLLLPPWKHPPVHTSFRRIAEWHLWVTGES